MRRRFLLPTLLLAAAGCGTTRTTDTTRAATEMLLVSQAVDKAVGQLDFSPLKGKAVFLDVTMIDKEVVDKGYLISSLRQQLLAHGAFVMEEKNQAVYVVEARTGGIGTDRHSLLFGSPALSVPALVPGVPTNIPEIALYKRTDQKGVAKIAAFAYNRVTGRAVWQSGLVEDVSRLKDRWVLGSGPYSSGSIRRGTELAGEELSTAILSPFPAADDEAEKTPALLPTQAFEWENGDAPPAPQPVPAALMGLTGPAPVVYRPLLLR